MPPKRIPIKAELVAVPPPKMTKRKKAAAAAAPPPRGPGATRKSMDRLFLKKTVAQLVEEGEKRSGLKRSLTWVSLTLLGLGGIIGTGIFVLTGVAARNYAGPAIVVAFAIAGVVAALAALAYAELASMIPVAGSAYTYTYAGIGEIVAWVIAWDLILEYAVGAMTVAQGWSAYLAGLLQQGGIIIPQQWLTGPLEGGTIDVLAVGIVLAVTALLVYGIQESANVTNLLVAVKVGIIVFVILLGFTLINGANYVPFTHETQGWTGVVTAAGLVFFAYIGFDALSTTAEETKNPKRDLPIAILLSLGISTLFYILASAVITGMVPYPSIDINEPFGAAFEDRGLAWAAAIIRVSAVAGITSVLIVLLLSQPRIFFSMARDGLLPRIIGHVHPRFRTPWVATILTGSIVAFVGGLMPIDIVATVTNIGTLFAFALVSACVVILRYTSPDAARGYRMPLNVRVNDRDFPILAVLGSVFSLALIFALPSLTILVFLFWFGLGLVIYATYGYYKSRAAAEQRQRAAFEERPAVELRDE